MAKTNNINPLNEKLYGFYRGIVIQNNDPNRRGRVKIFSKELAATIIQALYFGKNKKEGDKLVTELQGKFMGANIDTCLTPEFVTFAKQIAIWAEQASPLIGGGSSGFFDGQTNTASVSHANRNNERFKPVEKQISNSEESDIDPLTGVASTLSASSSAATSNSFTKDNTGVNKAKKFEADPAIGGHESYSKDCINNPNPFNNSIAPISYTNQASGLFGVPTVGAHVWFFFDGGNIQHPVYFAFNYNDKDWNGSYHVNEDNPGKDYPDHSENVSLSAVGSNQKETILRNKTVWKSKGGSVEIVDDDLTEAIRLNHYSGSCLHLTNHNNLDFSNTNKTTLVNQHNWTTVKGTNNLNVQKDNDTMIDGNNYKKVGKTNLVTQFVNWVNTYAPIALILSQFSTLRAKKHDSKVFGVLNVDATQSGSPAKNPAYYDFQPEELSSVSKLQTTVEAIKAVNNAITLPFNATPALITSATTNATTHYESANLGLTSTMSAETPEVPEEVNTDSTSSKNGNWSKNTSKETAGDKLKQISKQLSQIEKEMGTGGTEIVQTLKDKIEIIGAATNNFPAVRIDDVGDISMCGMSVGADSGYPAYKAHPYYEPTGMGAPFPGGNSTLIVQNSYNIIAGAGGVQIKTSGITQIGGSAVNIAGDVEVSVNSKGNVRIFANGKTQIGSKDPSMKDSLVTLEHPIQVAVDSSLGVSKNIIVGGSSYTEGETYVQHVTAPCEIQETEKSVAYGETISGTIIGYTSDGSGGYQEIYGLASAEHIAEITAAMITETDTTVLQQYITEIAAYVAAIAELESANSTILAGSKQFSTYAHSHSFKNLPLTLVAGNTDVRQTVQSASITDGSRGIASPQKHGYKEITSS